MAVAQAQEKILLRITEAADLLALGRTTVYNLIRSGDLTTVRIGGAVRIPMEAVKKLAARQEHGQNGNEAS
jgi:excisionase family DNA binding protein